MKVLLDECVPQRLRTEFSGHEVTTVGELGWKGTQDRALVERAESLFDALVTVDRRLPEQAGRGVRKLRIIVLTARSNRIQHLRPLVTEVLDALRTIQPGDMKVIGG